MVDILATQLRESGHFAFVSVAGGVRDKGFKVMLCPVFGDVFWRVKLRAQFAALQVDGMTADAALFKQQKALISG